MGVECGMRDWIGGLEVWRFGGLQVRRWRLERRVRKMVFVVADGCGGCGYDCVLCYSWGYLAREGLGR